MYRTSSFDGEMDKKSKNNFDYSKTETDKIFFKFTPPPETRFYSENKYSPRLLSKSVPRRNRALLRYKINRSLNFDECNKKNDFLSPKSTNTNSNESLHLSRSAKILKALNIDYNNMKSGYKKINKTLNFDSTPSPKRFPKVQKRRCTILGLSLSSPGINKSLNFDSCDESPSASTHDTSVESIDENQNQTPSQRSRKVKKSQSYISLISNGSRSSFDFNLLSPTLRTDLREKIDDIVVSSMSPPMQKSAHYSYENLGSENNIAVSTPRNLYQDFSDEDDARLETRPETPENVVRIIPESMSAIKKSHRKERFSGRFMHRTQLHPDKIQKMEIEVDEERPSTPISVDQKENISNYSIQSIKKSHKKDKSRRKICENYSDDEQSETGSLFDYSEEIISDDNEDDYEDDENGENKNIEQIDDKKINEQDEKNSILVTDEVIDKTAMKNGQLENLELHKLPEIESESLNTSTECPKTPENRIDYLKTIITDSIKKSHKKLKDSNKKSIYKSKILVNLDEDDNDVIDNKTKDNQQIQNDDSKEVEPIFNSENRATTPENMNSSRLLLAQFSSVKKSHRKDKHRKIAFAQRHALIVNNNDRRKLNVQCLISPEKLNIPTINISGPSDMSNSSNESLSPRNQSTNYNSLRESLLNISDEDFKLISSPNKRKNSLAEESQNLSENSSVSKNNSLHLTDYESAEDEFKIFTPIKKRKSFSTTIPRVLNDCSFSTPIKTVDEVSSLRCETPRLGVSFINDQDNDAKNKAIVEIEDNDSLSGRITPENTNCLRIISALSSIKKSHKKDKWTKARKSKFQENDQAALSKCHPSEIYQSNYYNCLNEDASNKELSSPRPSTSYSSENNTSSSPMQTPPNNPGAKTYLRLMQTTSIKRSHKKMREQKHKKIIVDPNLSDDELIFKEKSKSLNDSFDRVQIFDDSNDDFMPLDNDDEDANKSIDMKYSRSTGYPYRENRSNDGSIFGSDEEEDNLLKN